MIVPLLMWCLPKQSMVPRRNLGPYEIGHHIAVPLGARWYQDMRRLDIASSAEHSYPLLLTLWNSLLLIRGNAWIHFHHLNVSSHCFVSPCLSWSVGMVHLHPAASSWLFITLFILSFLAHGNDQSYVHSLLTHFHSLFHLVVIDSWERLPWSYYQFTSFLFLV